MRRACDWCQAPFRVLRDGQRFCGGRCRQAAFRARLRAGVLERAAKPLRFAYADPPYPGRAKRYYAQREVDHPELIARLVAGAYDGWALSTSADSLRALLPLCPEGIRVCPWVKNVSAPPKTRGLHNRWEPLLVWGGRQEPPGVRDWLMAQPARFGGELPGRKPLAFALWLFQCLGMRPGDSLDDLFPGTGMVGAAWAAITRGAPSEELVELLAGVDAAGVLEDLEEPSPELHDEATP